MSRTAIAALLFCLFSPAHAMTIRDNPGGYVEQFADAISRLHGPVRIVGFCASACTMYLGYGPTCVAPGARFMFHAAYNEDGTVSREGSDQMWSFYPSKLKAYLRGRGGLPAPPGELWLKGSDLIGLGERVCRARAR